ncbi:CDP-glycerol glycerophosphotransferase family protein [Vagococcus sp. DIV0080]|uniref:CDP-glycerol glycerophosphotransferase family protein n=1 Tax=Candidatus Vagococcus giribetii TaxID=2230876 RepID=A0ABS3HU78_9ENTE|nr:CDP-glycerol glycerophosphotransferase family protein [Vagococcus sp. DIV0080]MBO0477309.1 CDP-glycerol glycerophosphotransferase family protein [Vagococcus sp. DIV0080]
MRPLNLINKILPKNKKTIVLYSNLGFRDNVKYLYDYLIENGYNESYKIVCSVDDYNEYSKLKPKNTLFISNKRGLVYFLTSKYFFYCFGKYPIYPSNKQIVINLWHGMPLKKIGLLEEVNRQNKYDYFSYVLSTSTYFSRFMEGAFGCDNERVLVCGQPRTDRFFSEIEFDSSKLFQEKYKKIFLWMPTFRFSEKLNVINSSDSSSNGLPLFNSIENLGLLNENLIKLDSCIVVKLHPMQTELLDLKERFSNIFFVNESWLKENNQDLYSLVSYSDALITDYSSIYFDYLLLDKPIGFTLDDIEDYKKNRGFIIENPLELMPGEKIYTNEMFLSFLTSICLGEDKYRLDRNRLNNILNTYNDGKNCERIIKFCGISK